MKETIKLILLGLIVLLLGGILVTNYLSVNEKETVRKEADNIIKDKSLEINDKEIKTDEDFEEYIEGVDKEVESITNKEELNDNDKSKLKNTFKTLTDFIFYDGKIKGKTFGELADSTKTKVIEIYNKIDSKIESKYPNYKEKIKKTGKKTYNNVKEKAIQLKDYIKSTYQEAEEETEKYEDISKTRKAAKEKVEEAKQKVKDYINN